MVGTPRFTVVTPVYNPPIDILETALESVRRQRFPDWEHRIVNDASSASEVRSVLDNAVRRDPRVHVQHRQHRGGIAAATNDALHSARGEFIAFLDHDDELHVDALAHVAASIDGFDDVDYVYTDEDKIDESGRHFDPFLKPDWSPDRFRCQMYTAHLSVVRRSLIDRVGALEPALDGAQDWDLVFRVTERARRIVHVPEVLYHWRVLPSSTAGEGSAAKPHAERTALRAIDSHLLRTGVEGKAEKVPGYSGIFRIRPQLRRDPLVSIVIPTGGGRRLVDGVELDLVVHAVDSIVQRSTYAAYEIVVVVDDHVSPDTRASIERAGGDLVRLVSYGRAFNFSEKVNLGVAHARGEQLLLLNDDVEVLPTGWRHGERADGSSDWIEQMLLYALQPEVGAVGAKLLYTDGRIQHAGIVLVERAPTHALYLSASEEPGYFGVGLLPSNYLAVTGACLMTSRRCFETVGGFDVNLPVNYNDVAYGLSLRDAGFRSVLTPDAQLFHLESATRPAGPVRPEELAYVRARWPAEFARDPYYHGGFARGRTDFCPPAYRANGTFVRPGTLRSDVLRARELLSEGGVKLLAERLVHRLRRP